MFSQGYFIDSQICIVALWLLYLLLLHRRVNLTAARCYLLLLFPVAFLLPLIRIPILPAVAPLNFQAIPWYDIEIVEEAVGGSSTITQFSDVLFWIYWAGVILFGLILTLNIVRTLWRISRIKGERIGHYRVVFDKNVGSAYSVFGSIFINDKYKDSPALAQILSHEQSHISRHHSFDLVWINVCRSLLWYNPVAWHTVRLLREVHEFQADEAVIRKGHPVGEYIDLLLGTEMGTYPGTAHPLCYSLTKKRLKMITQHVHKNRHRGALRLLAIVPVTGLLLGSFSLTAKANPMETPEISTVESITYNGHTGMDLIEQAETGTVSAATTETEDPSNDRVRIRTSSITGDTKPYILLDGKEVSVEEFEKSRPDSFASIAVLKGEHAIQKYGEKGKHGALVITTKGVSSEKVTLQSDDVKFTVTEDQKTVTLTQSGRPTVIIDGDEASPLEANRALQDITVDKSITILKGEKAIQKYGEKGKNGVIVITSKAHKEGTSIVTEYKTSGADNDMPAFMESLALFIVDGKEVSKEESQKAFESLQGMKSISVLKGPAAVEKYGEKGRNGVLIITTEEPKNPGGSSRKDEITEYHIYEDGVLGEVIPKENINSYYGTFVGVDADKNIVSTFERQRKQTDAPKPREKRATWQNWVSITTDENQLPTSIILDGKAAQNPPILVVDDIVKGSAKNSLPKLDATQIKEMHLLAPDKALEEYGQKGKNGAIIIVSLDNPYNSPVPIPGQQRKYHGSAKFR